MADKIERDDHSGVETTGHEWDGIKELNNPAPRWWLMVWLVTTIWAIGYWVVYPAWPTLSGEGERGGTVGNSGWTQYTQLEESQAEILQQRAKYLSDFEKASYSEITKNEALYAFGLAGGASAFKDNCATCHGTGGAGAPGYPNLNDDDWIWGGSLDDIEMTIAYGIRADHEETRYNEMPPFDEMLDQNTIEMITDFILSDQPAGAPAYADNCASCHGDTGRGSQEMGGPNLKDVIWLYAGTRADIIAQIKRPKHGMMPAWHSRLDKQTIRQLSLYVHSLGGGEM
ncbi:cytochrome-c oxidase, cbb3-type subunit III [Temperatibacter marinus]|uniref:Cbb3-type cytochrome c oxidase subunit n=1 Tax=Temperatibacter marinus TaxID=1456591 RepID=A0AA52EJX8_9PROT|nr:cytochrome-c oxidase, cbb3-type subunit III [Temperatibacter marinus]WND03401.1 cytochrome-c oxidase, cbb3-type subunit III [Temperatibacter marinus]